MGNKSVDRAEMAKAAQQIDVKHQQINQLQTRLRGEMDTLSAVWTGRASTAFRNGYERFNEEYEKVKKGLEQIHQALTETLRDYTIREEESEADANKFVGMI
ncbi:WXG100 family type VII secretion target [Tessaracoccus sp. OH4464_COT-324]|uniref:WXG100 family type VII secretion target n=1 Tax=Tessaracoccus sp. OH4464_COT-324 TaxID=2491059 RepID=UPI000F63E380|nr:WXG100 family type VII secretion target [Tessaracoccus sp. OH4464_COT-324]RRD46198.1 WXG100 family type VII secretion target [Tessaracoccus sp. OH4464_COT-324]